jgi:hypothetical protein
VQSLYWFIARHYLGAGRERGLLSLITWIALGGVTVGVTALIVVIAVMTGMQEDLQDKILESTPHVLVLEQGSSLRMHNWKAVVDTALTVDGVVGAAPFVLTRVAVTRGAGNSAYTQTADLYGVSVDTARAAATDMERNILQGALDLKAPASGLNPILLGIGLADRMQIFPGDTLVVISFENLRQGLLGLSPTMRTFEVTGTFATGMYDYDTQNAYTTLEAAQELLGIASDDLVSGVGVRTTDPELATQVGDEIQARLGFPYYVPHRGSGGVQHRQHPGDGGVRPHEGDRDPQGHGHDQAWDPARLRAAGLLDRGDGDGGGHRARSLPVLAPGPVPDHQDSAGRVFRGPPSGEPRSLGRGGHRRGQHHRSLRRHPVSGPAGIAPGAGGRHPP